jgi:hypothetical protein
LVDEFPPSCGQQPPFRIIRTALLWPHRQCPSFCRLNFCFPACGPGRSFPAA